MLHLTACDRIRSHTHCSSESGKSQYSEPTPCPYQLYSYGSFHIHWSATCCQASSLHNVHLFCWCPLHMQLWQYFPADRPHVMATIPCTYSNVLSTKYLDDTIWQVRKSIIGIILSHHFNTDHMASQPKSNLPAVHALLIEENASRVLKEIPVTFVMYLSNTGYIFTIII